MFALATAACVRTAVSRGGIWWWLSVTLLGCALEVWLGWRHALHGWVVSLIAPLGWYEARGPAQMLLVIALLLMLVFLSRWLLRVWRSDRRAGTAAMACWMAVCLFLAEAISLHAVDAVMYERIGKLLLIGWVWALLAGVAMLMALLAARRR